MEPWDAEKSRPQTKQSIISVLPLGYRWVTDLCKRGEKQWKDLVTWGFGHCAEKETWNMFNWFFPENKCKQAAASFCSEALLWWSILEGRPS